MLTFALILASPALFVGGIFVASVGVCLLSEALAALGVPI
jgi:hypothetical protein